MKRIYSLIAMGMMVGCSSPQRERPYAPPGASLAAEQAVEGVLILVKQDEAFAKTLDPKHFTSDMIILHGKAGEKDIELLSEEHKQFWKAVSESKFPPMPSNDVDLGLVGQSTATETFRNTATDIRDADWFIPSLTESEPITDLTVAIGSRRLRAVVVDATQAAKLYELALHEGRRAVMVKADSDGWRLRLGQIRPGEDIETMMTQAWYLEATRAPKTVTAVQNGIRLTAESRPISNDRRTLEQRNCPVNFTRTPAPNIPDANPEAFPILRALYASREINRLLALDRASGRPDHAKEACDLAREAKIVSPVSSLLMVDAKAQVK